MTRAIEHCDEKGKWTIVMIGFMEHCDERGTGAL